MEDQGLHAAETRNCSLHALRAGSAEAILLRIAEAPGARRQKRQS